MTTNMLRSARTRRALNNTLWGLQGLLAVLYGTVGFLKLTQPIPALAQTMIWPAVVPVPLVRFIGAAELAGAVGIFLPSLTRILPSLAVLAAGGLVTLQLCAALFHASRGEWQMLPANAVLLMMAAVVALGRLRTAPIPPRR